MTHVIIIFYVFFLNDNKKISTKYVLKYCVCFLTTQKCNSLNIYTDCNLSRGKKDFCISLVAMVIRSRNPFGEKDFECTDVYLFFMQADV